MIKVSTYQLKGFVLCSDLSSDEDDSFSSAQRPDMEAYPHAPPNSPVLSDPPTDTEEPSNQPSHDSTNGAGNTEDRDASNPPSSPPSSTGEAESQGRPKYTWQERLFMVKNFWKNDDNWQAVVQAWTQNFADKEPPSRNTILKAVSDLEKHGHLNYK